MLNKEAIKLTEVATVLKDGKLVVKIKVSNPGGRTLYAYGSVRRVNYDNNTGKLKLFLHDNHLSPEEEVLLSPHLREPKFVPLEGGVETEVQIVMQPTLQRIRSAAERGSGPLFEELRVSEAKEIEVEMAHQDTPFYYNPKLQNARQLKEWGKITSKAKFKVKPLQVGRPTGKKA